MQLGGTSAALQPQGAAPRPALTPTLSNSYPHSSPQCLMEGARGKKDWVNGSLAGAVAGAMLGLRSERAAAGWGRMCGTMHACSLVPLHAGWPAHAARPAPRPAVGSLPAAVKASAALAFASAMVDLSGGRLIGTGMVDDGATPPRRIFPYTS